MSPSNQCSLKPQRAYLPCADQFALRSVPLSALPCMVGNYIARPPLRSSQWESPQKKEARVFLRLQRPYLLQKQHLQVIPLSLDMSHSMVPAFFPPLPQALLPTTTNISNQTWLQEPGYITRPCVLLTLVVAMVPATADLLVDSLFLVRLLGASNTHATSFLHWNV